MYPTHTERARSLLSVRGFRNANHEPGCLTLKNLKRPKPDKAAMANVAALAAAVEVLHSASLVHVPRTWIFWVLVFRVSGLGV